MTVFQIIMMLAAGFFAYQIYLYIQGIDEDAEPAFMKEKEPAEIPVPSADEMIEEADQAYRDDDINRAHTLLEEIVRTYPDIAEARNKLAFVLSKLGDNQGAKSQYEASLAINDTDDMTHNALATLLASIDEFDRAQEHYKKAIEIDDNYEVTWFNYANLMMKMDRAAEAKEMYIKALEIDPEFEPAHEALKRLG